jgi:hypothetical protein
MIFKIINTTPCFKQLFKPFSFKVAIGIVLIMMLNIQTHAQTPQKKVVMISVDGTPDYLIDKFLKNGVLPANGAFARMKKYGAYAEIKQLKIFF